MEMILQGLKKIGVDPEELWTQALIEAGFKKADEINGVHIYRKQK